MPEIIQVKNLYKKFKEVEAVHNLSFSVSKGEVYGFLGQNGAGKSTTIRMLLTLVHPTSGNILIFGDDIYKRRNAVLGRIGAIVEKPDLYLYLSALENLQMMANLNGCTKTQKQLTDQLEQVGIADRALSKVRTFSQGMKQRLGIACALIHNPDLIILDEPTNGLDPQGIADVRNLVLHLSRNEGKTIFVSSHLLSEVELIADSMLIIDRGKRIAEGKVSELLNPKDSLLKIESTDNDSAIRCLLQSQWAQFLTPGKGLQLRMDKQEIPALTRFLVQKNIDIISLQSKHSLEEYFLSLTTSNQHVATYKD
ncbi:MAG TPA: ABC transporter ATP-binding protein [Flavisolibacter sp.]|nr:ABC transporter ATP-binding protein [Flavisolibacter sp.]